MLGEMQVVDGWMLTPPVVYIHEFEINDELYEGGGFVSLSVTDSHSTRVKYSLSSFLYRGSSWLKS